MRIVTFRTRGDHRPHAGVLSPHGVRKIEDQISIAEGATVASLIGAGAIELLAASRSDNAKLHRLQDVRLLAPLRPGKIVAVGLNYADHAAEGGVVTPDEPLIFTKFTSAVIGPGDDIHWDRQYTGAVDYEAELGVVIGKLAHKVSAADAMSYIAGYTCVNDISARDLQFRDGQWVRGKSLDTFCPLGPAIVTTDEIRDPQNLRIECLLNGELMQSASTAAMIFPVAELVSSISQWCTLEVGDVIATGTPPGVGYFRDPQRLLDDGDQVMVRIENVGELTNSVRL